MPFFWIASTRLETRRHGTTSWTATGASSCAAEVPFQSSARVGGPSFATKRKSIISTSSEPHIRDRLALDVGLSADELGSPPTIATVLGIAVLNPIWQYTSSHSRSEEEEAQSTFWSMAGTPKSSLWFFEFAHSLHLPAGLQPSGREYFSAHRHPNFGTLTDVGRAHLCQELAPLPTWATALQIQSAECCMFLPYPVALAVVMGRLESCAIPSPYGCSLHMPRWLKVHITDTMKQKFLATLCDAGGRSAPFQLSETKSLTNDLREFFHDASDLFDVSNVSAWVHALDLLVYVNISIYICIYIYIYTGTYIYTDIYI